jgi:hypothetical protein
MHATTATDVPDAQLIQIGWFGGTYPRNAAIWLLISTGPGFVKCAKTHASVLKPHACGVIQHGTDNCLGFSADGKHLAVRDQLVAGRQWVLVGARDGLTHLLRTSDGNQQTSWPGPDSAAQFFVTCSKENRVHIYNLADNLPRLYATLTLLTGPVRELSFIPHTKKLALIA